MAVLEGKSWLSRISLRFAAITMALSALCALAQSYLVVTLLRDNASAFVIGAAMLATAALPAIVAYCVGERLTAEIRALQRSAEAIAAGDLDHPVELECGCELGLLAESFRRMVSRLNANIVRMNQLTHTDLMTGLPNRAVINHLLALRLKAQQRPLTLFYVDLTHLKSFNDTLGQRGGDEIIRQASRRIVTEAFGLDWRAIETGVDRFGELSPTFPERIFFGRFAGDEFIALVPGERDKAELELIAEAILAAMRRPFSINGADVRIGVGVGIARAPIDSRDPQEIVCLADIAMSAAKKTGESGYVFYDQDLWAATKDLRELEADLRKAVEEGSLCLHYQPKVDAQTLEPVGVEALVRWRHPVRGLIPPSVFIPIAEQAGLMPALGRGVLAAAVAQCRQWSDAGLHVPIAVNASPVEFDAPDFVPNVLAVLAEMRVDPFLIEIEITETMLMTDFAAAARRVSALRDAGVKIAIDDFGVGFSNLSKLAQLPVNFIKVDRSLIERIGVDRKAEAIVRATIQMAHALGQETIAEGIETQQQAIFLRLARCEMLQGFLYARPMPAEEFEIWLAERGHGFAAREMRRAAGAG